MDVLRKLASAVRANAALIAMIALGVGCSEGMRRLSAAGAGEDAGPAYDDAGTVGDDGSRSEPDAGSSTVDASGDAEGGHSAACDGRIETYLGHRCAGSGNDGTGFVFSPSFKLEVCGLTLDDGGDGGRFCDDFCHDENPVEGQGAHCSTRGMVSGEYVCLCGRFYM